MAFAKLGTDNYISTVSDHLSKEFSFLDNFL